MGDSGALFLGVLLAVLTIRLDPENLPNWKALFIPVLLLAVPILDTSVAVLSRIKRDVSPFQGGQDHLSHRLIRSGFTRKQAALALWGLSGIFCVFAVLISSSVKLSEGIILGFAGMLWMSLFVWFFRTTDA
jgi:UDP-GlcNAc:undecaprenyl-phosphate GlcNAc-1-phosphate transferase